MLNNRPKAIFYCGANGSGKSTLRQFNQDRVSLVIDSDHIAAEINPEMPRLADMEAGKTALRLFRQALDNQKFLFPWNRPYPANPPLPAFKQLMPLDFMSYSTISALLRPN